MALYNLSEYSQNYSMTYGNLQSYYRDEIEIINNNALNGKLFKYKTRIVGKTPQRPERPGNEGDVDRPQEPAVPN